MMLQGNRMMQRVLPTLNDSSIIIYFHSLHKTTHVVYPTPIPCKISRWSPGADPRCWAQQRV